MFRMWFDELEKAIEAFRKVTKEEFFHSITVNVFGDFIIQTDENTQYIIQHHNFSVWRNFGDWRKPEWKEIK